MNHQMQLKTIIKNKNENENPNQTTTMIGSVTSSACQSQNPLKLLIGKCVYLDIQNSSKLLNKVKECLKLIEARLADCLSKEVNYVITNRCSESSPNAKTDANDSKAKLNFLSRSNSLINRTQAILEKAKTNHQSTTDILTTAKRLGINVLNLNDLEKYIEKYLSKKKSLDAHNKSIEQESDLNLNKPLISNNNIPKKTNLNQPNHKIYKLKAPFLKFESICKQYKPIYQEFTLWHDLSMDILNNSKPTNSPFQLYFSDDNSFSTTSDKSQEQSSKQQIFKSPTSSLSIKSQQIKPQTPNTKLLVSRASSFSTNLKPSQSNLVLNPIKVKKPTGYCECCKQRYDNLKQHLSSSVHENFERNVLNFKEIDEYITGVLNFNSFLIKNNLITEKELNEKKNLQEIKEFAATFNKKRNCLGLTQTQLIQFVSNELNQDPVLTESAINRFEKLDITPRSGSKFRPVLEKLLSESQLKFSDRINRYKSQEDLNKKRKRFNGSFSPESLNYLNEFYKKNSYPNDTDLNLISNQINYDLDLVKDWFSEKKKLEFNLKQNNNLKKFKKANLVNLLNNTNTSLLDDDDDDDDDVGEQEEVENEENEPDAKKQELNNHTSTPPKETNQLFLNQKKKTPSLISSFNCSSPSASVLFGLNNNTSFSTIQTELVNTPVHNTSATTKLLASKVDLISGNAELQTITTLSTNLNCLNGLNNQSKSDNSTDLSCIDDVVLAAFVNDFSYEIVQK